MNSIILSGEDIITSGTNIMRNFKDHQARIMSKLVSEVVYLFQLIFSYH